MRRRGEIYKEISERFCFLSDVPHNVTSMTSSSTKIERYSQFFQKLLKAYPEDLNTTELQLCHSYRHHMFSVTKNVKTRFSHAELYKIIVEDILSVPLQM